MRVVEHANQDYAVNRTNCDLRCLALCRDLAEFEPNVPIDARTVHTIVVQPRVVRDQLVEIGVPRNAHHPVGAVRASAARLVKEWRDQLPVPEHRDRTWRCPWCSNSRRSSSGREQYLTPVSWDCCRNCGAIRDVDRDPDGPGMDISSWPRIRLGR